jgi:hypothetical protein
MGHTVADMVDAFEGGDYFFVVSHYDDCGLERARHVVENADNRLTVGEYPGIFTFSGFIPLKNA